MTAIAGRSVLVVGGSRGLGRGIAHAARDAGARVTAVARDVVASDGIDAERGDATDETFADKVLARVRPDLLVVTADAIPPMGRLTEHTWETFSAH
ncbi:NAD-dependent epimerase/dehydratase family protein [Actinoplanes sp. URMC 104]|uniref:NAD-dependent epimerase/dehydratase family protein n=1 Tax=Actinoplanes sp. URMC 104 TaxID=3423409 RepID=UPI003F1964F3